jgi:hypothetical protein
VNREFLAQLAGAAERGLNVTVYGPTGEPAYVRARHVLDALENRETEGASAARRLIRASTAAGVKPRIAVPNFDGSRGPT